MSRNIVFEGWLTKSPPSKRIWRTKWRRRWFALRQSGELPGQYFLDYYADRNYRRLKGTINLDLCEQVDAGLHMERSGNGSLNPKIRGSVFTIQTQSRIYHLEADSESDMERWVDAICRVCGLRATDGSDQIGHYQNNVNANNVAGPIDQGECNDAAGPYIPISECRTGAPRAQGAQSAFTFDPRNIVTSIRNPSVCEHRGHHHHHQMYSSHHPDSENDSTMSEEDCRSLNASQQNIRDYQVTKSFTKLSLSPNTNTMAEQPTNPNNDQPNTMTEQPINPNNDQPECGPPVPPRPPKTLSRYRADVQGGDQQRARVIDPLDTPDPSHGLRLSRRQSHGGPPPAFSARSEPAPPLLNSDEEDDEDEDGYAIPNPPPSQYCNLPSMPPAVDRNLKPRRVRHSTVPVHGYAGQGPPQTPRPYVPRSEKLQYLDLDLTPRSPIKTADGRRIEVIHGKSYLDDDAACAYKTVDFLKTEAFNITRQDAEASRNSHY